MPVSLLCRRRMGSRKLVPIILSMIVAVTSMATEEPDSLFNLTLSELLQVEVATGTLRPLSAGNTPVTVTVITAEDIAVTPARDLLDLIEVYVPGAVWVNHFVGPRLGVRGILGDQNYSFLLLVNGKNMNLKTLHGPLFAIQNRDLSDIERIEIVRGPGSVTHGPGAIAGVINLITRGAGNGTSEGELGFKADHRYRAQTGWIRWNGDVGAARLGLHASWSQSSGEDGTQFFYIDRAHGYGYGFMGPEWGNKGLGTPAPPFFGDFRGRPQVKLNLDLELPNGLQLWGRYETTSQVKTTQQSATADGPAYSGHWSESAVLAARWSHRFSETFELATRFELDSASHEDAVFYAGTSQPFNHGSQRSGSFSENEIHLETVGHFDLKGRSTLAVGAAYSYEFWEPRWGCGNETFLLSLQAPIRFIVRDDEGEFYQVFGPLGFATVFDTTIDGAMGSLFAEAKIALGATTDLFVSARADHHEYADTAWSPRIALVTSPSSRTTWRLVAQQSTRLPVFPDLFSQHLISDDSAEPEQLTGLEASVQHAPSDALQLTATAYATSTDRVQWVAELEGSSVFGTQDVWGLELESAWRSSRCNVGLSYSYLEQLDWDPLVEETSNMFTPDREPMPTEGFGENRINNFPRHSLKGFANWKLSDTVTLHLNGRFEWDWQQDALIELFLRAHERHGKPATIAEMQAIADTLADHGYAQPQVHFERLPDRQGSRRPSTGHPLHPGSESHLHRSRSPCLPALGSQLAVPPPGGLHRRGPGDRRPSRDVAVGAREERASADPCSIPSPEALFSVGRGRNQVGMDRVR